METNPTDHHEELVEQAVALMDEDPGLALAHIVEHTDRADRRIALRQLKARLREREQTTEETTEALMVRDELASIVAARRRLGRRSTGRCISLRTQ